MISAIDTVFTYDEFESRIEELINIAYKERLLEKALNVELETSAADCYVDLLASFFLPNQKNYFVDFYDYWPSWHQLVKSAIYSFVYGVVDYSNTFQIIAPSNHELLHLDSLKDEINTNHLDYVVPMNSTKDLWRICTGDIPVRERFS